MINKESLLQLACTALPVSDLYSVPEAVLERYVHHALHLRANSPFCKDISEEMFTHFVFCPRVNSEKIVDCRSFFYDKLIGRIADLSGVEAMLEVNRWCAENMTYQMSDARTESPLAAYASGLGRCGEESTFAVTALRSVGIPARQIYVPWWAHCDDNHAWVEAYVDGGWHFFGACEPEPVPDRGWFLDASSRAPMACYRTFWPCNLGDGDVGRSGCAYLYSVIDRYAETTPLTVCARPGSIVRLSVVNMAALRTVAEGRADETGCFTRSLGRGSYHAEADGLEADVTLGESPVDLTLHPAQAEYDMDCFAPVTTQKNPGTVTPRQLAENDRVVKHCAQKRTGRIDSYFLEEYRILPEAMQALLHLAGANAPEICSFYNRHGDAVIPMLRAMAPKDMRDTPLATLEHHWQAAQKWRDRPHFTEAILNPRIGWEELSCWRGIGDAFPQEPEELARVLEERYPEEGQFYPTLRMVPEAVLKAGCADRKSREILFIAILRSRGIPARFDPAERPEYYQDGSWHTFAGGKTGCVILESDDQNLTYGVNFGIARKTAWGFAPLDDLTGREFSLAPGTYRLVIANRLPNGNQLCHVTVFSLEADQTISLPLILRQAKPEEMLGSSILPPFALYAQNGETIPSSQLLAGKTMLLYLEPGREPTEHVLRELMAANMADVHPVFILRNPEEIHDPVVSQALAVLRNADVCLDSGVAGLHARKLFLEPGVLPLMLLTDASHWAYFGTCGYNVGSVELALRLAREV